MAAEFPVAQAGLNGLVADLWAIAQGKAARPAFPLRIVDDPQTVRAVLASPQAFPKNYAFLEAFAHGRFSDNGQGWQGRLAATQPAYARNPYLSGERDAAAVYGAAFSDLHGAGLDDFAATAVEAAIGVVSHAFGVSDPIPWPTKWNEAVREALTIRQWIGFAGTTPQGLAATDGQLAALRAAIAGEWAQRPDVQALLDRLRQGAGSVVGFDPIAELIQNLMASSETTAASLMWAAAVFAKQRPLQDAVRTGEVPVDAFVSELLRAYPPVPFVTRFADRACQAGAETFAAGEPIVVSIFSLHYDAGRWPEPSRFDSSRFAGSPTRRDDYLPFLSGPRACGGRRLAELELRVAIPALVERYDIALTADEDVLFDYGLSFRPRLSNIRFVPRRQG